MSTTKAGGLHTIIRLGCGCICWWGKIGLDMLYKTLWIGQIQRLECCGQLTCTIACYEEARSIGVSGVSLACQLAYNQRALACNRHGLFSIVDSDMLTDQPLVELATDVQTLGGIVTVYVLWWCLEGMIA